MPDQSKVKEKQTIEYILVSDKDSKILLSTEDKKQAKTLAKTVRQAGGEVTVFRSLSL